MREASEAAFDRRTGRPALGATDCARRLSPKEIDALAGSGDAGPAELSAFASALGDMPARRREMLEAALAGAATRTEIALRFRVGEQDVDRELNRALRQALVAVRMKNQRTALRETPPQIV